MEYRHLGKAGVKVSALGLGCNSFGTWLDKKATERVVHYALDQGINFFDTADTYSDGLSEEFLGKALKGKRSEVVIATKFGMVPWGKRSAGLANPNYGGSRYYIMKAVNQSLSRLQTDHIDLYQIHVPDPATPIDETLRALDDLVRAGKVIYIGCSNFNVYQLRQAMETSKKMNLEAFVTAEELYNLIDHIEPELIACYQAYGLGLLPYKPLRSGFLTGKYRHGEGIPAGSRYDVKPSFLRSDFLSDHNFDILEKLEKLVEEYNHSIGEMAIAWLLSHPWVSSVIAGSSKPEQIAANLKGSEWKLTDEIVQKIDAIV